MAASSINAKNGPFMTIGGLGPKAFDHLDESPTKKGKNSNENPALKALADISEATAVDQTLNKAEISVSGGGGLYSSITGAATALAGKVLGFGASLALPPPTLYDKRISSLQNDLEEMTGELYAADLAKTIGLFQLNKIQYFLENPEKLTPKSAESGTLKNFITISKGKIALSFTGTAFLEILHDPTSRALLEKTFEVNLLKALKNGLSSLMDLKPEFAVRLVQDILVDAKHALVGNAAEATEDEHVRFMKRLNLNIVNALFPNGAADIVMPLPFEQFFSKKAFVTLQEKQLPRKIAIYYEKATSDSLKYRILASAANELKKLLESEPKEKKSPTEPLPTYKDQTQFNKDLKELVSTLIDYIDDPSLKLLKHSILKKIEKLGPELTGKLLSIDMKFLLNKRLAAACQILSHDGYWQPENGKERFHYVPHIPTTREERAKLDEMQHREKKREFEETLTEIAQDLDQHILRLTKVPAEKRAKNIKEGLEIIHKKITHGLLRVAMKLFHADKRISKLSERVLELGENLSLKEVLKPVKRSISRKM